MAEAEAKIAEAEAKRLEAEKREAEAKQREAEAKQREAEAKQREAEWFPRAMIIVSAKAIEIIFFSVRLNITYYAICFT